MRRRSLALIPLPALALTSVLAGAPASAADGLEAAGLTSGGTKVTTFSTADGVAAKQVRLTGLVDDRRLVGIDHRPQDGALYGVGDASGLYRVDPRSGAATLVGRLTVALEGSSFGVDFNPAANALRVISDTGQNLRQLFATVVDGLEGQAATVVDRALNYGGTQPSAGNATTGGSSTGGTPATGVTGAAYTNNDSDSGTGATGTMLLDIDTGKDVLAQQNANPGILTARGPLGVDTSEVVGFDVYSALDGSGRAVSNEAFAVLTVAGERGLYGVDLTTGTATFLSAVTRGVSDLAIATRQ